MSRMLRNIIIMIAMVVVAVGAILLISNLGKDGGEVAAEPTQDPVQHIYVDYPADDIVDITVENESGSYTLYRTESANFGDAQPTAEPQEEADEPAGATDEPETEESQTENEQADLEPATGEQAGEAGSDLVWKIKGSETTDINQSDAGSLARYASYLYINEIITEDMSRKAEFGLEDYTARMTTNFTDGTTKVYYYGSQVPAESAYYMYVEGEDKIFTVSATYGFHATKSALDLYALGEIGLTSADISQIRLERDGKVVFHTKPAEYKLGLGGFDIVEPFRHMVNGDTLVKANTEIEGLTVEGVIDGSGNLKKYGLDEPWGKLTVTGKSGYTSVFMVGDEIDEFFTACAFEGDSNIYKIYTTSLGIFGYNTYQMVDKYLAMLDIKNVDEVVFSGFGLDDVELEIKKELQTDANGDPRLNTAGEQVYDNIFSLNGKKLGEEANEQGTWYYQNLIVPMSNSIIMPEEFSIEGLDPAGSIVFELSIDPGKYTVEFYEYNADFYVASVNGQNVLHKIADSEVEKLIDAANKALKGEIERPY